MARRISPDPNDEADANTGAYINAAMKIGFAAIAAAEEIREPTPEITGRDEEMIIKALAYAVVAIGCLPEAWQEASDAEDMHDILKARLAPAGVAHRLDMARVHLTGEGFPPDHPSRRTSVV